MKSQVIKGALAALAAATAAYFRALLGPVLVLALVMASDYVTGVLSAYRAGELSSRTGLMGILKKLGYLFCVGVAVTVDFTVHTAGARLGYDLEDFCAFALLVTVWLILNECLSILENLTELGVPVPGFLRAVVQRLKGRAESKGEENAPLEARRGDPVRSSADASTAGEKRNAGDGNRSAGRGPAPAADDGRAPAGNAVRSVPPPPAPDAPDPAPDKEVP